MSVWEALMSGDCPAGRFECECPQCSADDDEENAILRWTLRKLLPAADVPWQVVPLPDYISIDWPVVHLPPPGGWLGCPPEYFT